MIRILGTNLLGQRLAISETKLPAMVTNIFCRADNFALLTRQLDSQITMVERDVLM